VAALVRDLYFLGRWCRRELVLCESGFWISGESFIPVLSLVG
jgi:hypothetical protein